jgi:hypothetical protein
MKKCAKCGARYDSEYDGCPECASIAPRVKGWTRYERNWQEESLRKYGRASMSPRQAIILAVLATLMAAGTLAMYFASH